MTDLDKKVLEAIHQRRLVPRPYAYFLAKRSVFWTLAGLSLVLGAFSVAVAIFTVTDYFATGGRGFDEMPFDDVAEHLPAVWFVCFLLFVASAVVGLSHTKRGYRYRLSHMIALVVGASAGLGLLLHALAVVPAVHNFVAARVPAYREFTYIPYDEWRRPDQGYLGGEVLSVDEGRSLRLRGFDGVEWEVDISSAVIAVADPLVEEGDVAIRGERTGPAAFKAEHIDAFD